MDRNGQQRGGRRIGAGRKPGSVHKPPKPPTRTQLVVRRMVRESNVSAPDDVSVPGVSVDRPFTALEFLQWTYRNEALPMSVRLFAATHAAKYETPALSAVAQVSERAKQIPNLTVSFVTAEPVAEERLRRIERAPDHDPTNIVELPSARGCFIRSKKTA